jgi:hypothetical protein
MADNRTSAAPPQMLVRRVSVTVLGVRSLRVLVNEPQPWMPKVAAPTPAPPNMVVLSSIETSSPKHGLEGLASMLI